MVCWYEVRHWNANPPCLPCSEDWAAHSFISSPLCNTTAGPSLTGNQCGTIGSCDLCSGVLLHSIPLRRPLAPDSRGYWRYNAPQVSFTNCHLMCVDPAGKLGGHFNLLPLKQWPGVEGSDSDQLTATLTPSVVYLWGLCSFFSHGLYSIKLHTNRSSLVPILFMFSFPLSEYLCPNGQILANGLSGRVIL